MASTGDYGGQCVKYAGDYFGKKFGVNYARDCYNSSKVEKLDGPESGCVACWRGGAYGHVGVVEDWDGSTMTFSDSNRKSNNERVIVDEGITEAKMKRITSGFQGYARFKWHSLA